MMRRKTILNNADGLGLVWLILIIVASVIVVGAAGYAVGKNKTEDDAQAKYNQQIQSLQKEIDKAKTTVNSGVQQGQDTAESLQAENAQLKSKVDEQEKKIADLEKQLEDATSNNTTTTPNP